MAIVFMQQIQVILRRPALSGSLIKTRIVGIIQYMAVIVKDYLGVNFDPTSIGRRLRKVRDDADLDQKAWAVRIGKTQQTVSNWERGRALPFQSDLIKYAILLNADLHWLITGERPSRYR